MKKLQITAFFILLIAIYPASLQSSELSSATATDETNLIEFGPFEQAQAPIPTAMPTLVTAVASAAFEDTITETQRPQVAEENLFTQKRMREINILEEAILQTYEQKVDLEMQIAGWVEHAKQPEKYTIDHAAVAANKAKLELYTAFMTTQLQDRDLWLIGKEKSNRNKILELNRKLINKQIDVVDKLATASNKTFQEKIQKAKEEAHKKA